MADVVLNTVTHAIYGVDTGEALPSPPDPAGVLSALTYMDAKLGGTPWAAASPEDQKRALITARTYLDTLSWRGTKTSAAQPLAWPRTGVVLSDGTAVDSTFYPLPVVYAEYELAFQLVLNPTLLIDTASGGSGNVKRLKAGSAEIEYFKSTPLTVLPTSILLGLKEYMTGSTTASSVAVVSGVTDESIFDDFRSYDIQGT